MRLHLTYAKAAHSRYRSPFAIALHLMPFSGLSTPRIEYEHIEDVERLEYYRPGGYHPIKIGDKLHSRYRIIHKLGHGTYSTTWLARDEPRQNKFVAIKVGIASPKSRETAVLSALSKTGPVSADGKALIAPILDGFEVHGHNGIHPCYVSIPARTSLSGAKDGSFCKLFQLEVARALAAQLVLAVAFTHAQGFVHGDLHLGNVLLRLPRDFDLLSDEQLYKQHGPPDLETVRCLGGGSLPLGAPSHGIRPLWLGKPSEKFHLSEAMIFLADFGEAFSPSREQRFESHTPLSIRPPETRFEPTSPLSYSSDIWTLACSIWSILGQRPLFDGFLATEDDITCEQVDTLGMLPPKWWTQWESRRQWFTEAGDPDIKRMTQSLEDRFEDSVQVPRMNEGMPPCERKERDAILAMLRQMLPFRPEARLTASQVLETEWMKIWALPEFKKIRQLQSEEC